MISVNQKIIVAVNVELNKDGIIEYIENVHVNYIPIGLLNNIFLKIESFK